MNTLLKHTLPVLALCPALMLLCQSAAHAAGSERYNRPSLHIEGGNAGFRENDVRVPGDGGTEFDFTRLTGDDTDNYTRIGLSLPLSEKHSLNVVWAPLEVSNTGTLADTTSFAGEMFAANTPTTGTYQFNAYKLTWRYAFSNTGRLRWGAGLTVLVRDANITLEQGTLRANDDDVGFVPALHLSGDYRLGDHWFIALDFDGLAGGPGRLFDVALKLNLELTPRWVVGAGARILEGGADVDQVYNFAWIDYTLLDIRYYF